jgi:hypothetical protein
MGTMLNKRNSMHRGLAATLAGSVLTVGLALSVPTQPAFASTKNKLCSEAIYLKTAFAEFPAVVSERADTGGFRNKTLLASKSIYAHLPKMVAAIKESTAKKAGLTYSAVVLPQYRSLIATLKTTKDDESAFQSYRSWLDSRWGSTNPDSLSSSYSLVNKTVQVNCGFLITEEIDTASPPANPGPANPSTPGPVSNVAAVIGGPCPTIGAHAPGTNLDCVSVGGQKQWQPKGSKLNPYLQGETFTFTAATGPDLTKDDFVTRSITVTGYLPNASTWVLSHPDTNASQIIDGAKGKPVRGVSMKVTIEKLRPENMSFLGAVTDYWLGDEGPAGCCESNALIWGQPPADALDNAVRIQQGETRQGNMVFPATDAELGSRPMMRIGWNNPDGNKLTYVYFAVNEVKNIA